MAAQPKLDPELLRSLCAVVADTDTGLTGSQIANFLSAASIKDIDPMLTKRIRLFNALNIQQDKDNCSNNVLSFLERVMKPVNYINDQVLFEGRLDGINRVLVFAGYKINEDGKVEKVEKAKNLSEAEKRANSLATELQKRNVSSEVLKYCRPELVQKNYFHAVLEAVKSIASRVRTMTNLSTDGAELIDEAFNATSPYIIINNFITTTEISEQKGFANLLKGVFGMFRNVTAHAAKIEWPIAPDEAFDLLTLVSLIHKKLDKATVIKKAP